MSRWRDSGEGSREGKAEKSYKDRQGDVNADNVHKKEKSETQTELERKGEREKKSHFKPGDGFMQVSCPFSISYSVQFL